MSNDPGVTVRLSDLLWYTNDKLPLRIGDMQDDKLLNALFCLYNEVAEDKIYPVDNSNMIEHTPSYVILSMFFMSVYLYRKSYSSMSAPYKERLDKVRSWLKNKDHGDHSIVSLVSENLHNFSNYHVS